jgi:hypothetical protein
MKYLLIILGVLAVFTIAKKRANVWASNPGPVVNTPTIDPLTGIDSTTGLRFDD